MEFLLICGSAFLVSALTFLSGFGLGTFLMPVFAVFFPVPTAIALTAVVHFLNNLFKLALVGKFAEGSVVIRFGLPGVAAAFLGAWTLSGLSLLPPIARYRLMGRELEISPVNLVVAFLIIVFVLLELWPRALRFASERKYLPLGGLVSGYLGGLSGHQGALRSAFLVRCGLSQEEYIGTGVVIACLVDLARLTIYGLTFQGVPGHVPLLAVATIAAFLGAFIGSRLLKKVTLRAIQLLVTILLVAIAIGLGSGLL